MKSSLKKLFINLKKTQRPGSTRSSSSISSASTASPSTPRLNEDGSMEYPFVESRGMFRTLEPVWFLQRSAMAHAAPATEGESVPFTKHLQEILEAAYSQQVTECLLPPSAGLPHGCTVAFVPPKRSPNPTLHKFQSQRTVSKKRDRPATVFLSHTLPHLLPPRSSSAPILENRLSMVSACPVLELNHDIRRTMVPVWWFEQDLPNGEKAMCRFDYKNQVRLEALAEGRSQMVLTDASFAQPFTVVLDHNLNRDQKEEWCGFMYLHPMPRPTSYFPSPAHAKDMLNDTLDNDMPMLSRRYSL